MPFQVRLKFAYWRARLRGEWLRLRITLASGRCGHHPWVGRGVVFKWPLHAGLTFGNHVRLGEYAIVDVPPGGRLAIGDRVTLSMGVVLASCAQVTIGSDVLIGEYSSVRDADHGMQLGTPMRAQPMRAAPVLIEDDVWIGRGACVLRGVTLATGAIVGANSAVTRSVGRHQIVADVPARPVRRRGDALV